MRVTRRASPPWLAGAAIALVASWSGVAKGDDRSMATELLVGLDPRDEAVKQAVGTLERATRMRGAGDSTHAAIAEMLAKAWAELARDRSRARAAEAEAKALEIKAETETAHVERERALLEEAIARSGRLKAEVAALATRRATGPLARNKTFVATDAKPTKKPDKSEGADAPAEATPAAPGGR